MSFLDCILESHADGFVATSNDPWGPTGTQMAEIAQLTYNSYVARPSTSKQDENTDTVAI